MKKVGFLPAVANDDLRRVLVGHDDGGAGESAAVGVGVVGLEGLLGHASMQVAPHFEHISAGADTDRQMVTVVGMSQ